MLRHRIPERALSIALGLSLLALPCRAGVWYVDAVLGSDSNPGNSPAAPWLTITHALATIAGLPPGYQTVNVAPGVYGPALGEVFPLSVRPGTRISGTSGSAQTFLEGPGSVLLDFGYPTSAPVDAQSGADGLTLRQASTGVRFVAGGGDFSPLFSDIRIENMSDVGISIFASATGPFASEGLEPVFERSELVQCGIGVAIQTTGTFGSLWWASGGIVLTDSVIRDSVTTGIRCLANGVPSTHGSSTASAYVHLLRCRVISSGIDGVYGAANALGQVVLTAGASLFAGNHGCGILRGGVSPFADITLEDCTIAMNSVCGVRAMGGQLTTLRNTIVARNGDDLDLATNATASFSDSGDGDLLGQPGCIAADPQFANTTGGDFRLRFGSPCAETGDPASSGASDLLGHVRPFDGNLDTLSSIDMGAFEFEPLHLLGTPTIGQQFGFEFWGPAGGFSALWLARAPLTTPQSTPFGDLYLDPGMLVNLGSIPVQPGRPYVVRRYVPNNPLLIGTTFSFQGLTDSAAAPLGSAYTNPISFVVLP